MYRTLLVVTAHPDDESFPMGGTLAKYAAEGARVVLVSATRGEAGIPGLGATETARVREAELRAAARALGVSRLEFLDYTDGEFARADEAQVVAQLLELFGQEQPEVVITFGPEGISGHPDHVATHRFVTRAFERARLAGRLFYLMPSEATQQGCGIAPIEQVAGGPVAAIDVGAFAVTKVRAMQAHVSQDPPYAGDPVAEADKLACHEYFVLARPPVADGALNDLFCALRSRSHNHADLAPVCQHGGFRPRLSDRAPRVV
jgi:N-acetylglucosamine malate deacetylase 2